MLVSYRHFVIVHLDAAVTLCVMHCIPENLSRLMLHVTPALDGTSRPYNDELDVVETLES